jgi:hypothetical protein
MRLTEEQWQQIIADRKQKRQRESASFQAAHPLPDVAKKPKRRRRIVNMEALQSQDAIVRVALWLPITVISEANAHEHWRIRHQRFTEQRAAIKEAWQDRLAGLCFRAPVVVTLTRLGKQSLDSDNLAGAFKACRDEVAELLGVDDADDRVTWQYTQESGHSVYAILIDIHGSFAV